VSRPKKSLGQNFLHDANVARKIVRAFHLRYGDRVLEIGPGKGALTSLLLLELPRLTAIELDDKLAGQLNAAFGERLTLYNDDVLDVDLHSLALNGHGKFRIVGNIPYNITSPILFWIIDSSDVVADCTLMMQREVAQRLVAKPRSKEYGILSVFAQYYSTPKLLFTVSPQSFYPVPDVTSAIVSLDFETPRPNRVADDAIFRALVRGTFGKRRKTLRNGLRSLDISATFLDAASTDLDRRPEELSVVEFVALANELSEKQIRVSFNATTPATR
jgi:16S rRNA (adenine1518-N6/adenine1519-N6)-dimethyltransferase